MSRRWHAPDPYLSGPGWEHGEELDIRDDLDAITDWPQQDRALTLAEVHEMVGPTVPSDGWETPGLWPADPTIADAIERHFEPEFHARLGWGHDPYDREQELNNIRINQRARHAELIAALLTRSLCGQHREDVLRELRLMERACPHLEGNPT